MGQGFTLSHNTLNGLQGTAISLTYAGSSSGVVDANRIGNQTVNSGSAVGDGIDLWSSGNVHANIRGNTIHQIGQGTGIFTRTGIGTLNLILSGNNVQMDSAGSQNGVRIASGSGGIGAVCVNPTANIVTAAGSGTAGMLVEQLNTSSIFEIQGLAPGTSTSAVASFLGTPTNTLAGGGGGPGALATQVGANGFTAPSGACTPPPTV